MLPFFNQHLPFAFLKKKGFFKSSRLTNQYNGPVTIYFRPKTLGNYSTVGNEPPARQEAIS